MENTQVITIDTTASLKWFVVLERNGSQKAYVLVVSKEKLSAHLEGVDAPWDRLVFELANRR